MFVQRWRYFPSLLVGFNSQLFFDFLLNALCCRHEFHGWSICFIPIVHLNATDTIEKMKNSNLSIFVLRTHIAHMYHHRWRCYRIGRFDLICSKSINIFPSFNQYRYFRFHCHCHIYRISMSTFFQTHCTNESNNWLCIWINGKTLKTDIRNKINLPIFPSSSASSSSGVIVVVFEPL